MQTCGTPYAGLLETYSNAKAFSRVVVNFRGFGPSGGGRGPAVRARTRSRADWSKNFATRVTAGAVWGQFSNSELSSNTNLASGPPSYSRNCGLGSWRTGA